MAFAFRKSLGVLALALTAAVLPTATATAAPDSSASKIGNYCLSNTWGTPEVRTRVCANESGQRWKVVGEHVVLAADPHYCLANTWGTPRSAPGSAPTSPDSAGRPSATTSCWPPTPTTAWPTPGAPRDPHQGLRQRARTALGRAG
ncbi:hypothetical protein ACFQ3Z_26425 [Streptomyces nogalater]